MKAFFILIISLLAAGVVAAAVYPMVSPYHARLRVAFHDPSKRKEALRQAVDFEKTHYKAIMGDKVAQYEFGLALSSGDLGFTDTAQAVSWFRRSAAQGYPLSEYAMAHYSFTGDGLPQDNESAATWVEKAAEMRSVPQTRELLGLMYAGGIGEHQDLMRGLDFLKTAQSSDALQLASEIDGKFKEVYALPHDQQDAALQKMAEDVKNNVRTKFPAMEKNLASQALVPPPPPAVTAAK